MINCSDLHGRPLYVNPDLLERIELTPDTQLLFINGKRVYVAESPEVIVDRIIEYRRRTGLYGPVAVCPSREEAFQKAPAETKE